MTEKRCATCKHWEQGEDDTGDCAMLLEHDQAATQGLSHADFFVIPGGIECRSPLRICTSEYFGCVLHEEKKS